MFDNNWTNMYQDIYQIQQINRNLLNQMNFNNQQMNPMMFNNMNMNNNPMDQIRMMSNLYQNNFQQMMGNRMQNMNNNNMNYNMNMNNNMKGNQNQDYRINLCFSTMEGSRIIMALDPNETIKGVLTKFLKRCNLEEYIGKTEGIFNFLFSGQNLDFNDNRKLKDVVIASLDLTNILVIDTNHLIGA